MKHDNFHDATVNTYAEPSHGVTRTIGLLSSRQKTMSKKSLVPHGKRQAKKEGTIVLFRGRLGSENKGEEEST